MLEPIDIAHGGPKPPCGKQCPERDAECHAHCPRYLVYEKKREAFRNERDLIQLGKVSSKTLKAYMDEMALKKNR